MTGGKGVLGKLLAARIGAWLRVSNNTAEEIEARPSAFCRRRKIPLPSKLGRKGGKQIAKRGPEYFRQLQASERSARAVGLPSPRNPAEKPHCKTTSARVLLYICVVARSQLEPALISSFATTQMY